MRMNVRNETIFILNSIIKDDNNDQAFRWEEDDEREIRTIRLP